MSAAQQRFDGLDRADSAILSRKDEFGGLLAREEGKTQLEASGEVEGVGHIFEFFAGEALRIAGEVVPSMRPGRTVEVTLHGVRYGTVPTSPVVESIMQLIVRTWW